MTCLGLVVTCSKSDDVFDEMSDADLKSGKTHEVTVPFKADFLGEHTDVIYPDETCGDLYNCRVFVDYEGRATHLGKMYGSFEFCACGQDNPDTEEIENPFAGGETWFIAANGDKLHLLTEASSVIDGRRPDHPEYVIQWWRNKFEIIGGTGRFEGASGEGWADDYNSSLDQNSHHHWTGTINLVKGKRKAGK